MIEKREVLKGTRYLLLSNGKDIFDKEYKTRLDNALDMNKPISQGILSQGTIEGDMGADK
jgi:transposase